METKIFVIFDLAYDFLTSFWETD